MDILLAPPVQPSLPGFPPSGPPEGAGGATIAVTLRPARPGFPLRPRQPVLTIDDHPVPALWGRVTTPVAPGPHEVHVHMPRRRPAPAGVADLTVAALPGQTLELEYRAPACGFMRGALGAPPQRHPGLAALIAVSAAAALLTLCVCLGLIAHALTT